MALGLGCDYTDRMTKPCRLIVLLLLPLFLIGCATPIQDDPDAPKHKWQDDHGVPKAPSHLRFR